MRTTLDLNKTVEQNAEIYFEKQKRPNATCRSRESSQNHGSKTSESHQKKEF